jgi:lipopolysaccharide export system permease protein
MFLDRPRLTIFLLKTIFVWIGLLGLALSVLGWTVELFEIYRQSLGYDDIPLLIPVVMGFLKIPFHLGRFLPFVVLGSTLLFLWKINRTRELTALYANGLSTWQLLAFILTVIFATSSVYVAFIQPLSASFLNLHQRMHSFYLKKGLQAQGKFHVNESGIWIKDVFKQKPYIFHATHKDDGWAFHQVTYYVLNDKSQLEAIYHSSKAYLRNNSFQLKNARKKPLGKEGRFLEEEVGDVMIFTTLQEDDFKNPVTRPDTLSVWRTYTFTQLLKKSGLSGHSYWMYFHTQWAKILQCLAMACIGFMFLYHPQRIRNAFPILFSVFVGFCFYFANSFIQALGYSGRLPLILAAWGGSGVMIVLSLIILMHKEGH